MSLFINPVSANWLLLNGTTRMREPSMKFPVICPECARESIGEFQIAVVATALITGKSLRLYSACHDVYWTATSVEREQLREYLAAISIDARELDKRPDESSDAGGTRPSAGSV
jgi:hypothetical protein